LSVGRYGACTQVDILFDESLVRIVLAMILRNIL